MPTLLAPAPTSTAASRSPFPPVSQTDLPSVAVSGRTLADYVHGFALDVPALRHRDVLDVAAGPSSFVAEACARGVNAVAVDPLYGCTADALAMQVQRDDARLAAHLRAAAQRFLADYATHFVHGRYVGGALPRLPFFDGAFDLVLCAHLLFVHAKRFDFEWHVAACRELARVSAGEVRLHPVGGAEGRPYPKLAALRRELRTCGIESEVVRVTGEFFAGSGSMLVLRKAAP